MTTLTPRTIVITSAAVQARRDDILAQAGIGFVESLALRSITASTSPPSRADVVDDVATPNVITGADVAGALDSLGSAGLVAEKDGALHVTAQGQTVADRIADANARSSAELLAGFSADELRTAQRVLDLIAERAANPVHVVSA